ncbi:Type II secretion system protein I [Pseudidiomarina piscicola]|uniref:Type II secretion system protein I n=1 Tax=Pseudidiomarina piscicola TaxID=2614830 RepID=A0A6S6WL01_9GAMM|nr:prepilin-type N-terminal cleavage/methylation domain-containing protein [Pseudidiomarina piscicola]CAB0149446.1 Type II secretion system protein I [Pseudidiomarina piscicola]VZT38888.1 Type II secretion system protein I [Pseudomonas aeruginosa]
MISNRRARGFTFVEVLVALVIIAIGVAGLVSLQRMFIQSSTRATERTAAMEMAQAKIEELRFTTYADLAAGSDTESRDGKSYALAWTKTDQYLAAGNWVTASSPSAPDPLPSEPDAKAIAVTVSWTERAGASESLTLEAWFNSIAGRDGGLVVTVPSPQQRPSVTYNPGAAPEVIAIRLTDDDSAETYKVKETTKPTPQVQSVGDRLQVTFDTVTYDEASQTQRIEDFVTVSCACSFVGLGDEGKTPARLILEDQSLVLDPNGSVNTRKMVGEPADSNQPELCTLCCRDHHDNSEMYQAQNVYRQEKLDLREPSGNHRHFTNVNGVLTKADSLGDVYEESCRMRRVNGYYVTYPDWSIKAVNVMSSEYLVNSGSSGVYTDYVRDTIRALILDNDLPTPPTGRDIEVVPGAYQMIGRAIYLDAMTTEHENTVKTALQNGEDDWLSKVPFYEVNLTLLGEWDSSAPSVATVTSEPIETIVDPENNYYGTYSRGRLQTASGGTTTVGIEVGAGNASILGNGAIHVTDNGVTYTSSLDATVIAEDSDDVELYSITGEINCLFYKVRGKNASWEACKSNDFRDVTITSSNPNISCSISTIGNTNTTGYSCDGIRAGSSVSISFGSSEPNTTTFDPASFIEESISENVTQNTEMRIN